MFVLAQVRDPARVSEASRQGGGEGGGAGDQRDTDDGTDIHVRVTTKGTVARNKIGMKAISLGMFCHSKCHAIFSIIVNLTPKFLILKGLIYKEQIAKIKNKHFNFTKSLL
jgi:hypothetical protein